MVRFNQDGDLLFSSAKDKSPNVWYNSNGELLGSYNGHTGAVWCLDVAADSKQLVTGSADTTAKLWDVETGKELFSFQHKTSVRACGFSLGGRELFVVTDKQMGNPAQILVYDIARTVDQQDSEPVAVMDIGDAKVTTAAWGPLNQYIYCGHENGELSIWDWKLCERMKTHKGHQSPIMDLQFSKERAYFITASKDMTAKLFDVNLSELKLYQNDRPLNSASISPTRDHVICGGGQEARDVTTTAAKAGKFEVRFVHKVLQEEIGRVKGHFGPINTVHFHPKGTGYASGGEDGYVRLNHFDPDYFKFEIPY